MTRLPWLVAGVVLNDLGRLPRDAAVSDATSR